MDRRSRLPRGHRTRTVAMKLPATNLSKYGKALSYGGALRPMRDWLVLLALTLVLLLLSVGWNLLTFKKVTEGEPLDAGAAPLPLREAPVGKVEALFEQRAIEAERYLTEYRFVDPSR